MLYLFGSGSYSSNRNALKIGFSDDMETREKHYSIYNPMGSILGTRDGDRLLELKLHLMLEDFKVEFLDEWFYDEDEVKRVFGLTENEIDQWIWENKSKVLLNPEWPKEGTMKYKILENLRKRFTGESIVGEKSFI